MPQTVFTASPPPFDGVPRRDTTIQAHLDPMAKRFISLTHRVPFSAPAAAQVRMLRTGVDGSAPTSTRGSRDGSSP